MKNETKPIVTAPAQSPDEVIADHVRLISQAWQKLQGGPLKRRAILLLLKDASGVNIGDIDRVLTSIGDLEKQYLKPATPAKS